MTQPMILTAADAVELLADRCLTVQFLTTALQAEPDAPFIGPLLRDLSAGPFDGAAAGRGAARLREFALRAQGRPLDEVTAELRAEYVAMFFASWRRVLAPYESVYRSEAHALWQEPSQAVAALYAAEGLAPQAGFTEPPDHIALELAYFGYLCRQSHEAASAGDVAAAQAWLAKQAAFLAVHLLPWAPHFCRDLEAMTRSAFYQGVAALALDFLEADAALLEEIGVALSREA